MPSAAPRPKRKPLVPVTDQSPAPDRPLRIVHLISEYSEHEAMGRTVTETARNIPGEHHLVTTRAHDKPDVFSGIFEVGGSITTFPMRSLPEIRAELDRISPDVVHVHSGALGPIFTAVSRLGNLPLVMTIYAWPVLPSPGEWRNATVSEMRASNVLQTRVALTTLIPRFAVTSALRRLGISAVLTPDPRVREKLSKAKGIRAIALKSGAPVDSRRAVWSEDAPTILFAGRSESVRGIDTILAAFPAIRRKVPNARLRLLLIPRPELETILSQANAGDFGDALEVITEPVSDLLTEMTKAQVGVWPFKFDYTTSPPAMAVAEALSVGLPVVATDVACVRAVLTDGENGRAVPANDPQALADAVASLLTNREQWQRYAAAGPISVADFSWQEAAETTLAQYHQVIAKD